MRAQWFARAASFITRPARGPRSRNAGAPIARRTQLDRAVGCSSACSGSTATLTMRSRLPAENPRQAFTEHAGAFVSVSSLRPERLVAKGESQPIRQIGTLGRRRISEPALSVEDLPLDKRIAQPRGVRLQPRIEREA